MKRFFFWPTTKRKRPKMFQQQWKGHVWWRWLVLLAQRVCEIHICLKWWFHPPTFFVMFSWGGMNIANPEYPRGILNNSVLGWNASTLFWKHVDQAFWDVFFTSVPQKNVKTVSGKKRPSQTFSTQKLGKEPTKTLDLKPPISNAVKSEGAGLGWPTIKSLYLMPSWCWLPMTASLGGRGDNL